MSSPSFVPLGLTTDLSTAQAPWNLNPGLLQRLHDEPCSSSFKQAVVLPSDPEHAFILKYFCAHKPPGYSISKIICVQNVFQKIAFETELHIMEQEAIRFPSNWRNEPFYEQREEAFRLWKKAVDSIPSLALQNGDQTESLLSAKVLPLWHGSSENRISSICSTGFTYFGKHHFFDQQAQRGNFSSGDVGYFGSGIYFTSSAKYATIYSQGHLLLSWVSMREPYPVISDRPRSHSSRCSDMRVLEGRGAFQAYNAHYIPVVSINPAHPDNLDYYPCSKGQPADVDEIVVFNRSQTLPSFWIQVSPDLPISLQEGYSSNALHTAAFVGEIRILETWIEEESSRLFDKNDRGENLWYSAIRGNQFAVLKWLHTKNVEQLKALDENGSTLMHLTCALGDFSIAQWIFQEEPDLVEVVNHDQLTPLHLAGFNQHLSIIDAFLSHLPSDFLFQCSKHPCSKTIAHLFDKGIPASINHLKQTLLHLAAQSAQEENIILFLDRGFDINAQDIQGRTPLFLAVLQGHRMIVELLIRARANVELCSNEQENLLSVAAFYGYTLIVQDLLKDPLKTHFLTFKDSDGKTALHKAVWGNPKPEIVSLLLENGADPHCVNNYNYTPLHWAAKHGHEESVKVLMRYGATADVINVNEETPLDLSCNWGKDSVVHLFLGTPEELLIEERSLKDLNPVDLESYYTQRLLSSKQKKFIRGQLFYLEKLSDIFVEKKNFLQAAKILNCAVAILNNISSFENRSVFIQYLLNKLERIEGVFLEAHHIKTVAGNRGYLAVERTYLRALRGNLQCMLAKNEPIPLLLQELTANFKGVLKRLILSAQKALGPPPAQWACMGMGSMARGEMCPYSDVEFAFVTENESLETLKYFRLLTQLVELKIVNMGETKFPVFGEREQSPTCSGFCLDIGGNTPFGNGLTYELIGTPKNLARFQKQEFLEENIILSNAMGTVCFIAGNEKLVKNYQKERDRILDARKSFFGGEPHRVSFAIELIKGHLKEFHPELSATKEKLKAFGIKAELYRPFQEMISSLALFYHITATNTLERVNELVKKGVFCDDGGENLQEAIKYVLDLRLQAHFFYESENEIICHSEEGQEREENLFYLNEAHVEQIRTIYMVLIPFFGNFQWFCLTKNCARFNRNRFFAHMLEQTRPHDHASEAELACQQALSLDPRNVQAMLDFANIAIEFGNSQEALMRAQRALQMIQETCDEKDSFLPLIYKVIGDAFFSLERYEEALSSYEEGLSILLPLKETELLVIATYYNKIAGALSLIGDYDKALALYHNALGVVLTYREGENYHVIATYSGMAVTLESLGDDDQAWEFHVKAMTLARKLYVEVFSERGDNLEAMANSYECAGNFLKNKGCYQEAIDHYQKAWQEDSRRFRGGGKVPLRVAKRYKNMGDIFKIMEEYEEALEYQKKAVEAYLIIYGESHPIIKHLYSEIAKLLSHLDRNEEASEWFQKTVGL